MDWVPGTLRTSTVCGDVRMFDNHREQNRINRVTGFTEYEWNKEVTKMRLKRRVTFSAAHAYWFADLTLEENQAYFGRWASKWGHGHNYVVEVTLEGDVDFVTGMVVNIVDIDKCLKDHVLSVLSDKHLTYEVEWFKHRLTTLENISLFVVESFQCQFKNDKAKLVEAKVWESETLFVTRRVVEGIHMVSLTRCFDFAASHRLHAPQLSDAENVVIFGKCNHAAGHGHNYGIEVTVSGEQDSMTGMLVDLERLDAVIAEHVMLVFDHKCLNDDVPEFKDVNPTSENLTRVIWNRLVEVIPSPAKLSRVLVRETDRNYFEFAG